MISKMKKIAGTLALAASLAAPSISNAQSANAQPVTGSLEYLKSEDKEQDFARINANYKLPLGIDGYSWLELYEGGKGYFGGTVLSKKIASRLSARVEPWSLSEPLTWVGFGAQYDLPMPKGTYATARFVPFWVNTQGSVEDRIMAGYFAGAELGKGFSLRAFGEANIKTRQWGYGELRLMKEFGENGRYQVGYNPRLRNNGDLSPRLEHAVQMGVKF